MVWLSKRYERLFVLNEPNAPRLNPALACEIGLNESIILLQIEFWISISNHFYDGRRWTYQSVRDIQEKAFPFWSIATINRVINKLLKKGYLIEGNYNKKSYDKTRWFALNFEKLQELESISVKGVDNGAFHNDTGDDTPPFQNDTHSNQNETRSNQNETTIPETTTDTTTELVNNPILRECLNILKSIKNYPFDTEKDIELINSLLIDFPSLDIKEELKKWAIYKLDKPLKKDSNPRLQFRNWCKNSAKWKAEKEQQDKGTSEQPFRQTKSEMLLPIEYYKFHGLPIPEEVRKREEEGKKANEQMPSSEKVSEILKLAKKEILNKKGEDNGSP